MVIIILSFNGEEKIMLQYNVVSRMRDINTINNICLYTDNNLFEGVLDTGNK